MFRFPNLTHAVIAALCASVSLAQAAPAEDDALIERLQRAKAELQTIQAELDAKLARTQATSAQPTPAAPTALAAVPAAVDDDMPELPAAPIVKVTGRNFDPLRLKVVMKFPPNVKTIQQATQYLLETANYKLALSPDHPEETRAVLSRPLLPQDRDGSLKAIEDALLQISGDDTVLVIDREHKMLSFEFHKP
jgi:hypothetical protein